MTTTPYYDRQNYHQKEYHKYNIPFLYHKFLNSAHPLFTKLITEFLKLDSYVIKFMWV